MVTCLVWDGSWTGSHNVNSWQGLIPHRSHMTNHASYICFTLMKKTLEQYKNQKTVNWLPITTNGILFSYTTFSSLMESGQEYRFKSINHYLVKTVLKLHVGEVKRFFKYLNFEINPIYTLNVQFYVIMNSLNSITTFFKNSN